MSKKKETDFFTSDELWARGPSWYARQFRPSLSARRGESSPSYTRRHYFPDTAKRIQSLLPEVQLIYLVRAPLQRALSHYFHSLLTLGYEAAPGVAFSDDSEIILESNYSFQIEPYAKQFDLSQIMAVSSELLFSNPQNTMGRVFQFLAIDDRFWHPDFTLTLNPLSDLPPTGFFRPSTFALLKGFIDQGYVLSQQQVTHLLESLTASNHDFNQQFNLEDKSWRDAAEFRKFEAQSLSQLKQLMQNTFFPV